MAVVAGVDGCRTGWFVVLTDTACPEDLRWKRVDRFSEVLCGADAPQIIAIDVPIGLLSAARRGSRTCDQKARATLRAPRASSVFPPPVRGAINQRDYAAACAANRASSPANIGISSQCFGIVPKIREIDDLMSPELEDRVWEIHPELCFWKMAGGHPMRHNKSKSAGREERLACLVAHGLTAITNAFGERPSGVQKDDILDAAAACWTALRIHAGEAKGISGAEERDDKGLRMEMWV
ncbi:DUF429 domain-containing protein [Rhodospira trueperi]|uniref:Predicted nuclease (RNAse H fold) n=1 Tax=Rhodospira trueperi TaxID=69960 RepID=A0A1G6YVK4_9PROT|nr:DUF429 domain-containing protein [Rhodospira trueperi]SDD93675.1 Predicted nuclease (RNAse H fold) [Rhodospira trueperi]